MNISLQRRFQLFLLIPVVLVLVATGVGSFIYARAYLLDQWTLVAKLKLEKTAHQIRMDLDNKRNLINLIVDAETIPKSGVTQAYLIQKLRNQEGVLFVDIQPISPDKTKAQNLGKAKNLSSQGGVKLVPSTAPPKDPPKRAGQMMGGMMSSMMSGMMGGQMMQGSNGESQYDHMVMGRMMHGIQPIWLNRSEAVSFVNIIKDFDTINGVPTKRLKVRVSFQSFLKHVLNVGHWEGSYACLVTEDGTYLAHTDPIMYDRKKLGASGNPLEKQVLEKMKQEHVGFVFGKGHPPTTIVGFNKIPTTNWYLLLFSKGSEVLEPILSFRFHYILAGILTVIVIALIIRFSTEPVARSVAEISKASEKVEKGQYDIQLPEGGTDEIGQLKRRFTQMAAGLKQRELIERTFGRYVDKAIADELMNSPEALTLGGESRVVTIMMADLRGFTKMSEHLTPKQVIHILNGHYSKIIAIIEKYRGIIVDFYGDSVLVFFNGIDVAVAGRATEAVKCAVDMQRAIETISAENVKAGLPALAMGIGIHTGEVVVGNIGSETRAKYGIVGSAVNETDRIQSYADGGVILISKPTLEIIGDRVIIGRKRSESLKGLEGYKELYEVESIDGESHLKT